MKFGIGWLKYLKPKKKSMANDIQMLKDLEEAEKRLKLALKRNDKHDVAMWKQEIKELKQEIEELWPDLKLNK